MENTENTVNWAVFWRFYNVKYSIWGKHWHSVNLRDKNLNFWI